MTVDTLLMIVLGTSIFLLLASFAVQIGFGLYFRSAYIVWLWQTAKYYVATLIARLPVDLAKRRLPRIHAQIRPVSTPDTTRIGAVSWSDSPVDTEALPLVPVDTRVFNVIHAADADSLMLALVTKYHEDGTPVIPSPALAHWRPRGSTFDNTYETNLALIERLRALYHDESKLGMTMRVDGRVIAK